MNTAWFLIALSFVHHSGDSVVITYSPPLPSRVVCEALAQKLGREISSSSTLFSSQRPPKMFCEQLQTGPAS